MFVQQVLESSNRWIYSDYLTLRVDEIRGIAFLRLEGGGVSTHFSVGDMILSLDIQTVMTDYLIIEAAVVISVDREEPEVLSRMLLDVSVVLSGSDTGDGIM